MKDPLELTFDLSWNQRRWLWRRAVRVPVVIGLITLAVVWAAYFRPWGFNPLNLWLKDADLTLPLAIVITLFYLFVFGWYCREGMIYAKRGRLARGRCDGKGLSNGELTAIRYSYTVRGQKYSKKTDVAYAPRAGALIWVLYDSRYPARSTVFAELEPEGFHLDAAEMLPWIQRED
jgi:hypothetical protein